MSSQNTRNRYFFGLGTVGRDMFYTMVSMFLVYYLTDVLNLDDATFAVVGGMLTGLRIFDALNDPIMGYVVDNTNSRWGKFKPWVLFGALSGSIFMVLLFTDLGVSPVLYIVLFALFYLAWDILYGLNDIGFWSMLPAVTLDQKEREKVGSFAKICANIGLFSVVVGIKPLTDMMAKAFHIELRLSWFIFAVIIAVLMIGFQMFTLFGVKERRGDMFKQEEQTSLKGMVKAIFGNDQLLFATISLGLFMIGYCTTTNFGLYFFKYAFGNADMYSVFAFVLGVSQIAAFTVFPLFSKRFTRRQLYFAATIFVVVGYVIFFFSPMNMIPIGIAGMLIFLGQAFISLLMLMFLADTIEYGQWKLGKRNQSITFSIQPLINKIGGAIATGIMTVTLIVSGINSAKTPQDVTSGGLLIMKLAMLVLPLICIVAGYLVYRFKYKIDKKFYDEIVSELTQRGDIMESGNEQPLAAAKDVSESH